MLDDDTVYLDLSPVVERIKTAREHGDLKENAEYHAAREEQSFLEGRVQALEDRLRRAVVVEEAASGRVISGSKVTVETDGDELTYTIVGSAEAGRPTRRIAVAAASTANALTLIGGRSWRLPASPTAWR